MKKDLFDETEGGSKEAGELATEVWRAIAPLFDKYYEMGYKAREIANVMTNSIMLHESATILRNISSNKIDKTVNL